MNIKIGIASDHRGFAAKEKIIEFLDNNDINVVDFGTKSSESVDFPLYAKKLGNAIQNEEVDHYHRGRRAGGSGFCPGSLEAGFS